MTEKEQLFECYPQIHGKRFYLLDGEFRDNNLIGEKSICFEEAIDAMNQLNDENKQLKEELKDYSDANARLEERIKELEQTIDTISKDYEESHGMDIRNAEWFTAW